MRLAAAQRLNYDVLCIIFALVFHNWNEAALTLSSVCRLWRYTILSMPQIWSRIHLGTSIAPSNLRKILEYSKPLPLHIVIPSSASKEQLKVLSSATDRIVCMRVTSRFHFLRNRFPILERLRIENDLGSTLDELSCLPQETRFPKLKEFSIQMMSPPLRYEMVMLPTRFAGVQKLEMSCTLPPEWAEIIQGVSTTLVSLVLRLWGRPNRSMAQFSFPQLRHLRISKTVERFELTFDLDAPQLECIERVFGGFGWGIWDCVVIRLRNPRSVKQLRVMGPDFDLSAYPALRKLWICSNLYLTDKMLGSLGDRIASCPDLKTILYCHPSGQVNRIFMAIFDVVQATGRDIAVREILPDELDLPGDMRRSQECLRWPCYP